MNIIFDTDVIIDVLRGREESARQIEDALEQSDAQACSAITIGEIHAGMRKNEESLTIGILDTLKVYSVDTEIAELAGKLKRDTKSHALALDDCIIAATAILNNATLFTKNVKDYPFPKLKLQKIK